MVTGLAYFAAGVLAGGTLGAVIGAVIATLGIQQDQQDRGVDGPHAAWTRPRRLVCLACRLGECAVHQPFRAIDADKRRNGGAS